MVHVGMRNDHIPDQAALRVGEGDAQAARIYGNAIVDQKAGQALRRVCAAAGIE